MAREGASVVAARDAEVPAEVEREVMRAGGRAPASLADAADWSKARTLDPYTGLRTRPNVRKAVTATTLAAIVMAPIAALVLGRRRPSGL